MWRLAIEIRQTKREQASEQFTGEIIGILRIQTQTLVDARIPHSHIPIVTHR